MSIVTLDRLVIGYRARGRAHAVAPTLNAELREGELTVLLGPNGAGKSTLMRTMCGLQDPLDGIVKIDGESVAAMSPMRRARVIGVVLTRPINVWGLTAWSLVGLGRQPYTGWAGQLGDADREIIATAMRETNALQFAEREVAELSDGERQRVMVARALAQEPRALVMDEVTSFLDWPTRVDLMLTLRRLARNGKRALFLSTHDLDLALRTADRIWLMGGSEMQVGTPHEVIASGALEAVFRHDEIAFDRDTATFRIVPRPEGVPAHDPT